MAKFHEHVLLHVEGDYSPIVSNGKILLYYFYCISYNISSEVLCAEIYAYSIKKKKKKPYWEIWRTVPVPTRNPERITRSDLADIFLKRLFFIIIFLLLRAQ